VAVEGLDHASLLLRAEAPASVVAARLAAALGFTVVRDTNLEIELRGPRSAAPGEVMEPGIQPADVRHGTPGDTGGAGTQGPAAVEAGVTVDPRLIVRVRREWDTTAPVELFRGFDTQIRLRLSPTMLPPDYDGAAWGLFDAVTAVLGVPVILTYSGVYVAGAWSPQVGSRRFDEVVFAGESGRVHWGMFEQPPVTVGPPMWPTDEDRLGWRVTGWPAEDDLAGRLYQQILAAPDDDELRLAYADAVAGEHPKHAELIRTQVAYSRDRRAGMEWPPQRQVAMTRLARELRDRLWPISGGSLLGKEPQVKRGFFETLWLPAWDFIRFGGLVPGLIPLRMAYLTDVGDRLGELADSPNLSRLVGLSLWGNQIGDQGLARLLRSPYLGRLRYLSVENTGVTKAGIEALAASEALPELRYVNADHRLGLNPFPYTDYDGTVLDIGGGGLGAALASRYDRAWLHSQATPHARSGREPDWDEV
jgi:uncharacterized protein (TIGR02996 family)